MPQLKLYLFGAPHVTKDDVAVEIPRRKVLAALLYLAMSKRQVQRNDLATLLWPGSERKSARSSLRRELHALNNAIGTEWLEMTREDVMMDPDADVWIDVDVFRQSIAKFQSEPADLSALEDAATLYQGDFLAGFTLSDCPAFDDWQFFEAEELRQDYANALAQLVYELRLQKKYDSAINYARRWLTLDTMDEPAYRELMQLYALAGQQAAALRQYDECVRVLNDELGVPPDDETTALAEAIRSRRFQIPSKTDGKEGSNEDETRTVSIPAQSLPSSPPHPLPPSSSLSSDSASKSTFAIQHNLPSLSTSFVGRQQELEAIESLLLHESECRLLTLVGPGGIGKTRLALAAAQRIVDAPNQQNGLGQDTHNQTSLIQSTQPQPASAPDITLPFRDGIYFIPLASIGGDDSILPALADALSFSFQSNVDPKTQLVSYLKTKALLLILDNFEQILEQSNLLSEILISAPQVMIVTTSREALSLQEEWLYAVNGFPTSTPTSTHNSEQVASNHAVQLFVQRARRADSSLALTDKTYEHISRICRLVDGMPLGIELAATWVRVLSIEEIGDEIESSLDFLATTKLSVSERHSSMRTVLDQTWQLLSAKEQDTFCKLSIFESGFTRQAANRVADASVMILAGLVRKSIVNHNRDGRYTVHGLLRQFAAVKLQEDATLAQAVAEKHSRFYSMFLQTLASQLSSTVHAATLEQIGQELENIRSGWRWLLANASHDEADIKLLNSYVEPIFQFYDTRSRFQEGWAEFQNGFEQLRLAKTNQSEPDSDLQFILGRIRSRLGWFAFQIGQSMEAKSHLLRSLEILSGLDTPAEVIFSLNYLGAIHRHLGEYDEGKQTLSKSEQLCRTHDDRFGLTVALNILGQIAYEQNEYVQAQSHLEESLTIKETIGDRRGTTFSLLYLGLVAKAQGDYAKAMRLFQESKLISEEYGDRRGIALGLSNLADVETALENPQKAQELFEESLKIYTDIQNLLGIVTTHINLGDLARGQNNEPQATRHYQLALRSAGDLKVSPQALDALIGQPREWLETMSR